MPSDLAIEMRNISKTFPGVKALSDVNVSFRKGEIHALLGENGAGKSTLMNVLTGIYQQNAGSIAVNGEAMEFRNASDAIKAGIGMVHQHFKLVNTFTVAQNLHLGWDEAPRYITHQKLNLRAKAMSEEFGLELDPWAIVDDLSAGEQQRIEIVRVLARGTQVLIVDEPTAVLTPTEVDSLFKVLRTLREAGRTIIFISHKLDEVLDISDRVTILRRGKVVASHDSAEMDTRKLANLMVGREVIFERMSRADPVEKSEIVKLENVSAIYPSGAKALKNVNLSVRSHEILGIAGVAGNGQRALSEVISGMLRPSEGRVTIDRQDIANLQTADITNLGVGHIPEDRLRTGFAGDLPVSTNAVLRKYKDGPISNGVWFNKHQAVAMSQDMVAQAEVATPDVHVPIRTLSGGNQQRLIAKRECDIAGRVLISVYPMRGLDVGAISRLREMIMRVRDSGAAVVLISEELEELLEMSDRIAVLNHGKIVGTLSIEAATMERIGLLMGGEELEVVC